MVNVENIIRIIRNQLGLEVYNFDTTYYTKYMDLMWQWYKGKGPASFHSYTDTNGVTKITKTRSHLNMAKRVCEDQAGIAVNNNLVININDEKVKKFLLGQEEVNGYLGSKFYTRVNSLYELVCALGTGATELSLDKLELVENKVLANSDKVELKLIYHNGFEIIPLTWDENKDIKSVAFVNVSKELIRGKVYNKIYLTIHYLFDTGYRIYNKTLIDNNGTYNIVPNADNVVDVIETGSTIPMFSILKLNNINNYDLFSPYGASIFANALDALESADVGFTLFRSELDLSEKKVAADKGILPVDENGNQIMKFTELPNMFYVGDGQTLADGGLRIPFQEFNPEIRIEPITKAIQTSLNLISSTCGLGNNYYKFDNGTVKTATEVISENSACYRNICRNEMAIEDYLRNLLKSIIHYINYFKGLEGKNKLNEDFNISIDFDTSIIEDKAVSRERDLKEVEIGTMTVEEFREKWYGIPRTSENTSFIKEVKTEEKTDDTSNEN